MAKPSGFSSGFSPGFGVGRYRYVLAPYTWITNAGPPHWRMPSSVVGAVDLRPLPAQGTAGGSPTGVAFAASLQPVNGTELVRSLNMIDEDATNAMRDGWQGVMGYRPQGVKLVDMLWDQLTTGADPTGDAGPKPLLPDSDNVMRLLVGGHSVVKSERFVWGKHPHTNRVQDVYRRDFERLWEESNGGDHCRRMIDLWCKRHRIEEWKEFVPARLHAHVPGRLPHATTISETFNKADSDTLGPELTWTETAGDWDVVSNECEIQTTSSDTGDARAEHNLSSADNYAEVTFVNAFAIGDSHAGAAARFSASARTYYQCVPYIDTIYLQKVVTGTATTLDTEAGAQGNNDTYKAEANGTTIKGYQNGAEMTSSTDSAISGNLRTGMSGYKGAGGKPKLDAFTATDFGGGATTSPWHYYQQMRAA